MPQGTTPNPQEFQVQEEGALKTSLEEYLAGDEYERLRKKWIPGLLSMAEQKQHAGMIAMLIRGTVSQLSKDYSPAAALKTRITRELFGLFFGSKEVAEEAWEQIPASTLRQLERTEKRASPCPTPIRCLVIPPAGSSNRAGRREGEFNREGPRTVDGFSSAGPPVFDVIHPPFGPPQSSSSPGITSYGVAEQSKDERSSTDDGLLPSGPPGFGIFASSSLPYLGLTPYSAVEQSESELPSTANPSEYDPLAGFGLDVGLTELDDERILEELRSRNQRDSQRE